MSIGLEVDDIIDTLSRLSKNDLDPMLLQTMREHGSRIGKLKLVLQDNAYFIECVDRSLLDQLQTAPEIKKARKNRQRVGADGKMALV